MIENVDFRSQGATLRGLLFRPDSGAPSPLVIMTHGTSATLKMVADEYAEVFRRNGIAALLFDHRNFGISDGEPRQEIGRRGSSRRRPCLTIRSCARHTSRLPCS